jgi:hypothetical protein
VAFKDGDVVKYNLDNNWCRHGIAIIRALHDGKLIAEDTYWGSNSDYSTVDFADLKEENIIGNKHEFSIIPYPYEYDDFEDSDKYWIPMGARSERKCVRKGAIPTPAKIEERLRREIERLESKVKTAAWNLEWKQKELAKHLEEHKNELV